MKKLLAASLLLASLAQAQNMVVSVNAGVKWTNTQWPTGMKCYPVWTRQDIWLPWARWLNAPTPIFPAYMREAAIVMGTGFRPDPPFNVVDLYPGENPDGSMKAFNANHPLFNALRILRAQGIRPVIDIGPIPQSMCKQIPGDATACRNGAFEWPVNAPKNYQDYFEFIRELFKFMYQGAGMFTKAEVESWRFQLGREPDNRDTWNPANSPTHCAVANLDEYKKLYDHTLAGMRVAGLNINLHPGNLWSAYNNFPETCASWTEPIAAFLTLGTPPYTSQLVLPRIRTGTANDTMIFSFSAYADMSNILNLDPGNLETMTGTFRTSVRKYYSGPLNVTVAEGGFYRNAENTGGSANLRSEGSELGAAWNAGIFISGYNARMSRYQQWGFRSATHLSQWEEYNGINGAPQGVIEMFRRMEGLDRMQAGLTRNTMANAGDKMNAMVAKGGDGRLFVLVTAYNPARGRPNLERVDISITGMTPYANYRVKDNLIDRNQGSYMQRMHADLSAPNGGGDVTASPNDAMMEYQFTTAQAATFATNRNNYRNLSQVTASVTAPYFTAAANSSGSLVFTIHVASNSVRLLEIEKPTTAPAILAPTLLQ